MPDTSKETLDVRNENVIIPADLFELTRAHKLVGRLRKGIDWAMGRVTDRLHQEVQFEVMGGKVPEAYPKPLTLVFHEGLYWVRV